MAIMRNPTSEGDELTMSKVSTMGNSVIERGTEKLRALGMEEGEGQNLIQNELDQIEKEGEEQFPNLEINNQASPGIR